MASRSDDVPPYVKSGQPRGIQNIEADDLVWIGKAGELDPDDYFEQLFLGNNALRQIVLTIIQAYPDHHNSEAERLDAAMKLLTGEDIKKRGRKSINDDDVLDRVARHYFALFVNGERKIQIDPLVRGALSGLTAFDKRPPDSQKSEIARIRNKFKTQLDAVLVKRTTRDDYDVRGVQSAINEILALMQRLRILHKPAKKIRRIK